MNKMLKFGAMLAAFTIIAGGCSVLQGDGVTDLSLQISLTKEVNPDDNDRPSPVFLRVVELREPAAFRNATYLDLYRDARLELGGSYLGSSEVGPLYPDSEKLEVLRLNTAAGAVGILGEFNRYTEMNNKVIFEFEPGEDAKLELTIDANGIRLD